MAHLSNLVDPPLEAGFEYLRLLQTRGITTGIPPRATRPSLWKLAHHSGQDDDLDIEVHPLFRYSKWLDLTFHQYKKLLPALRVATLLMQQAPLLRWFKRVLYGQLSVREQGDPYLQPLSEEFQASDAINNALFQILNHALPKILRMGFHPLDVNRQSDGMSFASIETFRIYCADAQQPDILSFSDPRIYLHSHYLWDLEYLGSHGTADDIQQVQLRIAITLVHELVHIVWKYRQGGERCRFKGSLLTEPLFDIGDLMPELGTSWEHHTFGGTVWAFDHPGYMTLFHYPDEIITTRVIIPCWWIRIWFRKSTWVYFRVLFYNKQLRLPTIAESGHVFMRCPHYNSLTSKLYIRDVGQEELFVLPEESVYLLWNVIRPRLERLAVNAKNVLLLEDGIETMSIRIVLGYAEEIVFKEGEHTERAEKSILDEMLVIANGTIIS